MGDVSSDIYLPVSQYFGGETFEVTVNFLNDSGIANITSEQYANAARRECHLEDSDYDSQTFTYSCTEYHYNYGSLSLVFFFLPSIDTIPSCFGPKRSLHIGLVYSMMCGILWVILYLSDCWMYSLYTSIISIMMYWQVYCIIK